MAVRGLRARMKTRGDEGCSCTDSDNIKVMDNAYTYISCDRTRWKRDIYERTCAVLRAQDTEIK